MSVISISQHLGCEVNLPKALKGESLHGLPPYARIPAYCVDDYPAAPSNWMRGSATEGSFFVGVKAGHGLWLDFNSCRQHDHHVAVLISIQGVNPITGKPLAGVKLDQYRENCPVHNVPFQGGRYCPECGYKWPAQNYLSTTGCADGRLWLDGFRGDDGEVRQYVFTEETCRGIAAQVLGDTRVFAIGVSFFLSVDPKPPRPNFGGVLRSWEPPDMSSFAKQYKTAIGTDSGTYYSADSAMKRMMVNSHVVREAGLNAPVCQSSHVNEGFVGLCHEIEATQLEIAAGARIQQETGEDPNPLSFWREKPESTLFINYLPDSEAKLILADGKRGTKRDGALGGLLVGNV